MNSLADAWRWYTEVRESLLRMKRLGSRYWDIIPWDEAPWRSDNSFTELAARNIVDSADTGLRDLDATAIVVLFSVFEAIVRGEILNEIAAEQHDSRHRVILAAIEAAKVRVGEGSFFNVLEAYKGPDNNLIEQVNQVRRYRNWVAHGRRSDEPSSVNPVVAYDRLTRFLQTFFPSSLNE